MDRRKFLSRATVVGGTLSADLKKAGGRSG